MLIATSKWDTSRGTLDVGNCRLAPFLRNNLAAAE